MPFNKPVLRYTRQFALVQHIEAWDQGTYFKGEFDVPVIDPEKLIETWSESTCNSMGCIAGWGSLIGGWHQLREVTWPTLLDEDGFSIPIRDSEGFIEGFMPDKTKEPYSRPTEEVVDELGNIRIMHEAARESFGFTWEQAQVMFSGGRTLDELNAIFDAIEAWDDNRPSEYLDFYEIIVDMQDELVHSD
jgi:hypothetical protein